MARALVKAREGDTVTLRTPGGVEDIDIVAVRYVPLATGAGPSGGNSNRGMSLDGPGLE